MWGRRAKNILHELGHQGRLHQRGPNERDKAERLFPWEIAIKAANLSNHDKLRGLMLINEKGVRL